MRDSGDIPLSPNLYRSSLLYDLATDLSSKHTRTLNSFSEDVFVRFFNDNTSGYQMLAYIHDILGDDYHGWVQRNGIWEGTHVWVDATHTGAKPSQMQEPLGFEGDIPAFKDPFSLYAISQCMEPEIALYSAESVVDVPPSVSPYANSGTY
jgi:hypothetical protein